MKLIKLNTKNPKSLLLSIFVLFVFISCNEKAKIMERLEKNDYSDIVLSIYSDSGDNELKNKLKDYFAPYFNNIDFAKIEFSDNNTKLGYNMFIYDKNVGLKHELIIEALDKVFDIKFDTNQIYQAPDFKSKGKPIIMIQLK